jgi:hypothetical protein
MAADDLQPAPGTLVPAPDAVSQPPAQPAPAPAALPAEAAPDVKPEAAAPVPELVVAAPAEPKIETTSDRPSLLETATKDAAKEDKPADTKPAEKPAEVSPADAKPAEVKPAEIKPVDPEAPAPVEYKYELPQTLQMDDALRGTLHEALDKFRANPAEGAQDLINMHADAMSTYAAHLSAEQHRAFNAMRDQWNTEWKADPVIGGAGYDTSLKTIARMRDALVPAEMMEPSITIGQDAAGRDDQDQPVRAVPARDRRR